ncbi:hypothetical protein PMAYCL1PPCAC_29798, partial [Pristionchus mayeri]
MDARRWLPCFDEPRYKANLSLVVNHPSGLKVVANSGVDMRWDPIRGRNRSTTVFLTTPRLPSYLYSFSLNNYEQFSAVKDGVKYSTYLGRRGKMLGEASLQM